MKLRQIVLVWAFSVGIASGQTVTPRFDPLAKPGHGDRYVGEAAVAAGVTFLAVKIVKHYRKGKKDQVAKVVRPKVKAEAAK